MTREPSGADGGSELVRRGVLRVDRERALDKLKDHQLPDAGMYLLPWLRFAVAAGARELAVRAGFRCIEVRIRDIELSSELLADPFSALFDEGSGATPGGAHLAVGILGVLRLRPESIRLSSGHGARRAGVRIASLESTRQATAAPGNDTVIEVAFQRWPRAAERPRRHLRILLQRCFTSPIPIRVNGRVVDVSPRRRAASGIDFSEGGITGWIGIPAAPESISRLDAHVLGARAGTIQLNLPLAQVEGFVATDALKLDASQTGIVRDQAFCAATKVVEAETARLLEETARRQRASLTSMSKLLRRQRLGSLWAASLDGVPRRWSRKLVRLAKLSLSRFADSLRGMSPIRGFHLRPVVSETARTTAWLRRVALAAFGKPPPAAEDVNRFLYETPLYLEVGGEVLSLEQLDQIVDRCGYLPVSKQPLARGKLPFTVVWCPSASEAQELTNRFGDRVRDLTENLGRLVDTFSGSGGPQPGAPPLEVSGGFDWLVRDALETDGRRGEVGLPREGGGRARLYLFVGSEPIGVLAGPADLRFVAVLAVRDAAEVAEHSEELAAAATRAAMRLYQRLARQYPEPLKRSRWQSIVDHLLDALIHVARQEDFEATPGDHWISEMPLFAGRDRPLTYRALSSAIQNGEVATVVSNAHQMSTAETPLALVQPKHRGEQIWSELFPEIATIPTQHRTRLLFCRSSRAASAGESDELGRVATILQAHGTLADQPDHPQRRALLTSVGECFSPWRHEWQDAERLRLKQILSLAAFFRRGATWQMSLSEVDRELEHGLTYVTPELGEKSRDSYALLLDPRERALVERLWPDRSKNLVPWQPLATQDADIPEVLHFDGPMVFVRRYRSEHLDANLGISYYDGAAAICWTIGADGARGPVGLDSSTLHFPGILRVQAEEETTSGLVPLLAPMVRDFYRALLAEWPVGRAGSAVRRQAVHFVLEAIRSLRAAKHSFAEEREICDRLCELPLFDTPAGGSLDLRELLVRVQNNKVLVYLSLPPTTPNDADELLPIIPSGLVYSTGRALVGEKELKTVNRSVVRAEPSARRRAAPRSNDGEDREVLTHIRNLLDRLRGMHGSRVWLSSSASRSIQLTTQRSRKPLLLHKDGRWQLVANHPLVRIVQRSRLSSRQQAAYLASIAYTSANRQTRGVTDADDVCFQRALIELCGHGVHDDQATTPNGGAARPHMQG